MPYIVGIAWADKEPKQIIKGAIIEFEDKSIIEIGFFKSGNMKNIKNSLDDLKIFAEKELNNFKETDMLRTAIPGIKTKEITLLGRFLKKKIEEAKDES